MITTDEETSFFIMRLLDEVGDDTNNDGALVTSNDSTIIKETLRIYGSLYGVCFLLFCFLRRRYPRLFNIRSWVPEHECELAKQEYGFFSWFWKVFDVSDEDMFRHCGMDALCFLRAIRMGRKLSLCGIINAIWLIPLYATAKESEETAYLTDVLVQISLANLPSQSKRFFGTVLASYIVFFYTMSLLFNEFKWYTKWRHRFLSKPWSRNYAVYVSGIPGAFQSSHELAEYFRQCSSREAVLEAHVAMDIPLLETKVSRRKTIVKNLEHAVARERLTGDTQMHRKFGLQRGLERVNTVSKLEDELGKLNREIERSVGSIMKIHDRFRSHLTRAAASVNVMRDSGEWSDDDSDAADYLVLSPVASRKSADYEGDPLVSGSHVNSLSVVPEMEDDSIHATLSREKNGIMEDDGPDHVVHIEQYPDEENPPPPPNFPPPPQRPPLSGSLRIPLSNEHSSRSASPIPLLDEDLSKSTLRMSSSRHSDRSSFNETDCDIVIDNNALIVPGLPSMRLQHTNSTGSAHSSRSNSSSGFQSKVSRSIASGSRDIRSSLALGSREVGHAMKKTVKELNPEHFIKSAHDKGAHTIKRAQALGTTIIASASAVVPIKFNKEEGKSRNAGFVLFSSLYAATSAKQMIHHPKPYVMDVQEAPDSEDIFWRNVGQPAKALRTGRAMSVAASAVLCVFWSIPMAFIASLTEVNSLKETVPKLGNWFESHPKAEPLLAQLAPLLLLLFNEVFLPSILKYFATWEGFISAAMLEASLFIKLGAFMIIQTFFVSAISGGITAELSNMLENPESILDLLANSLPAQSSYFLQILLASTFLMMSLEFLRVYQLAMAGMRKCIGPRLTEKERRRTWRGMLNSLEDPPEFWLAETFAMIILYFMVFFVYSAIAPITTFFLYFCFVLLESGYRYQFIHNYPRAFDTGGKLWLTFIQFSFACMLISQLTLIGLLVLKKSVFAGPAMGPLLAITILFIIFLNGKHMFIARHLPTRDCLILDQQNSEAGLDDDYFARGKYLQPALRSAASVEAEYEHRRD